MSSAPSYHHLQLTLLFRFLHFYCQLYNPGLCISEPPFGHTPRTWYLLSAHLLKMRALLRPLSTHTVYSPIETIVFIFVLATFAYFQILAGIKHSSFFAPSFPANIRPAYARYGNDEWLGIGKGDWIDWRRSEERVKALELQPIVFTLKDTSSKVGFLTSFADLTIRLGCRDVTFDTAFIRKCNRYLIYCL